MIPTQAQIEAAARAIEKLSASDPTVDISFSDIAKAALTAAAEVGDKSKTQEAYLAGLEDGRAATIERCAQVVENFDLSLEYRVRDTIKAIAAAIRALKNESSAM